MDSPEQHPSSSRSSRIARASLLFIFAGIITTGIIFYLPVSIPEPAQTPPTHLRPESITRVLKSSEIDSPIIQAKLSFYDDTDLYYPRFENDERVTSNEPSEEIKFQTIPPFFNEDTTLPLIFIPKTINMQDSSTPAMQEVIAQTTAQELFSQIGSNEVITSASEKVLVSYELFSYSEQSLIKRGIILSKEQLPEWHQAFWRPVIGELIIKDKQLLGSIFFSQSSLGEDEENFLISSIMKENLFSDLLDGYYQIIMGP